MSVLMPPTYNMGMSLRDIDTIDYRIERLQALMKRLRAERRLAVLREKHRDVKSAIRAAPNRQGARRGQS